MLHYQKHKESPEIIKIVAEIFDMNEYDVLQSVYTDPQIGRAVSKLQNGILTDFLGKDVWEKVRNNEKVIQDCVVPSEKLVILVGNRARHGKDTFADMLTEEFREKGISAKKFSFAKAMKEMMAEILNVTVEQLEEMKNTDMKYRGMLQRLGAGEMKKIFGENIWHQIALKEVIRAEESVIIFSDHRFPIEGDGYENAATIQVIRPEILEKTNSELLHKSETALDNASYDFKIINDGTLDDLQQKSRNIVDILEKRVTKRIDIPTSLKLNESNNARITAGKRKTF